MKPTIRHLLAILALTACADAAAPPDAAENPDAPFAAARAASSGATTTLPTFGGGGRANAINDAGMVVGVASERNPSRTVAGTSYPAKWARDEITGSWKISPLGTAGGQALAVNELGDAVGLLLVITGETSSQTAVVWPAGGGEISLETAGVAEGINDAGIIVGSDRWGGGQVAYVWVPNGDNPRTWTRYELPLLAAGGSAEAIAINEHSEIAGAATNAAGLPRAVVWKPVSIGVWSGPFPRDGTEASTGTSAGFAINDNGEVVGYARPCAYPCNGRPYRWPAAGGSFDLGSLNPKVTSGRSTGIAYEGQVVGVVNVTRGSGGGPFLWYPGATTLTDLGDGEVTGLNNRTARYGQEAVGHAISSRTQNPMVWRVP